MKEKFQYILLPLCIGIPTFWAIAQVELSRDIGDESVQSFYSMLARPNNPLNLPSNVHSELVTMVADGFSSNDYYDLNEIIRTECGSKPKSFFEKQIIRTTLGILQVFSFKAISVDSSIALSNGQTVVNQLDATLCDGTIGLEEE
ncbi:hypothetical protein [Alteromonas gracilis]|uniref:hypothetical protein n=1 Tax=Alteromonas gracilis TaxID=1479524 RepID=UPI003735C6F6